MVGTIIYVNSHQFPGSQVDGLSWVAVLFFWLYLLIAWIFIFQDTRIEGGYEAVPTRDIHMKQIGLEENWLELLRLYVKPLVEKQFVGFQSDVCILLGMLIF